MPRELPTQADPPLDVSTLDALFKGFADPTRIRILNVLAEGALCVCDVVQILRLPQPVVSRHLAYLRRMGLVAAMRVGKFAHYRLATPDRVVHRQLIDCARSCFAGVPLLDRERLQARQRRKVRVRVPC